MAYLAPIHRASSVRHALQAKLLSPDEDSLILAYVWFSVVSFVTPYTLTQLHEH
jgi:DNA damage-binding protein 1